jgi:hypothetical protein
MKFWSSLALVAAMVVSGCASQPQQPINLNLDTAAKAGRVGVAMTATPKVDTFFPGAGCLLCVAAASLMNSSLTTYTKTLSSEDIGTMKNSLADALRKKGVDVVVIEEAVRLEAMPESGRKGANLATKDFTSLKNKYQLDKLLLIETRMVGIERTYSAYVPTSDPKGVFRGTGYLVNLSSGTYEWYLPVDVLRSSDGAWDEPPKYPGLTNAYFQALEDGKDRFVQAFVN